MAAEVCGPACAVAIGENRFFFSSRNGVSGMEPHHSHNGECPQAVKRTKEPNRSELRVVRKHVEPIGSPLRAASHSDKRRRLLRPSKLVGRPRLGKRNRALLIIGCDFYTRYQQIAAASDFAFFLLVPYPRKPFSPPP